MSSRIRHGLLISIAILSLFITSVVTSYAETINYVYDELNRLIRVEYEDVGLGSDLFIDIDGLS